jgi:hypothetical protein
MDLFSSVAFPFAPGFQDPLAAWLFPVVLAPETKLTKM